MAPERWHQISRLYHAALGREPAERQAYLQAVCGEDEALRRELGCLLAHEETAQDFMEVPAMEMAEVLARDERQTESSFPGDPEIMTGRTVSRYRILEKLGEGGMGAVYRAVRADDEYLKQVAIKLVKPGLFTDF